MTLSVFLVGRGVEQEILQSARKAGVFSTLEISLEVRITSLTCGLISR